ncbi:MAG: hypothetical protein IJW51_02270 [Clostridia bacterium]|nr:hypothetical protein [Clostridia bacterium]
MLKGNRQGEQTPSGNKNTRYVILLCGNTVLFFLVYRVLIAYGELTQNTFLAFVSLVLYLALLLGFTLAYLIYNRFFWRHGLLPEQLPDTWSEAQKEAFLAEEKQRMQKSKWMLTVIFPLVVTFLVDAVDLFLIDGFLRG